MFKKEEGDSIETVIGPSVRVEGNFVANGDVVVEGIVSGSIKTEKNLRIGPNAKVFAKISAANALIAGEVQGNIRVKESLELTNSAKIFGDVKTNVLSVASGAILHGKCSAGSDKKSKFEKLDEVQNSKPKTSAPVKNAKAQGLAEKVK